jgi:hypothetical protein
MRRLFAIPLIVVLLTPWVAALTGVAAPVVPCPMHRSGEATTHGSASRVVAEHHADAEHSSSPHHGTTARGCNCAGECGRSGAPFSLSDRELVAVVSIAMPDAIVTPEQPDLASLSRLLPLATGPPQRLRI